MWRFQGLYKFSLASTRPLLAILWPLQSPWWPLLSKHSPRGLVLVHSSSTSTISRLLRSTHSHRSYNTLPAFIDTLVTSIVTHTASICTRMAPIGTFKASITLPRPKYWHFQCLSYGFKNNLKTSIGTLTTSQHVYGFMASSAPSQPVVQQPTRGSQTHSNSQTLKTSTGSTAFSLPLYVRYVSHSLYEHSLASTSTVTATKRTLKSQGL